MQCQRNVGESLPVESQALGNDAVDGGPNKGFASLGLLAAETRAVSGSPESTANLHRLWRESPLLGIVQVSPPSGLSA